MDVASFVSAMMTTQAMSSCFSESPHTYKAANGTEIIYCDYKGEKKFPGTNWTSTDCELCSCTAKEGLHCCKAAQHHLSYTNVNGDSECVQKKEGCDIKWVLKDNPDEACPSEKIPKETTKGGSAKADKLTEPSWVADMFPNDEESESFDADDLKDPWHQSTGLGFDDDHAMFDNHFDSDSEDDFWD